MGVPTATQRNERDGAKEAFALLVQRHWPLLIGVCRPALGDAGLAEDAAQEAVLQAMLGLDRLRRPERFGPWLAGIGLNVCHRWRRQRAREAWSWEAMLGGRTIPEPADDSPGPEARAEAAELRAWVEQAVANLPPGQRAAVKLFYLAGLTQAETAALLGIEVGAVKARLHKARGNLRASLAAGRAERQRRVGEDIMVDMRVGDVRRKRSEDGTPGKHVVILEEIGGSRRLPIWIGEAEATALALHLEGVPQTRPLTYAFAAALLQAAGGRLREVRIERLEEEVFYASAVVGGPQGEQALDARPSDALNLALLLSAPVRVNEDVLAACRDVPEDARWIELAETSDGAAVIAAEVVAGWNAPPKPPAPPAAEGAGAEPS